jgi:hypothetical protein
VTFQRLHQTEMGRERNPRDSMTCGRNVLTLAKVKVKCIVNSPYDAYVRPADAISDAGLRPGIRADCLRNCTRDLLQTPDNRKRSEAEFACASVHQHQ